LSDYSWAEFSEPFGGTRRRPDDPHRPTTGKDRSRGASNVSSLPASSKA